MSAAGLAPSAGVTRDYDRVLSDLRGEYFATTAFAPTREALSDVMHDFIAKNRAYAPSFRGVPAQDAQGFSIVGKVYRYQVAGLG